MGHHNPTSTLFPPSPSRSIPLPRTAATAIMVYVRQDKLPNLKQYKYSGVDHSLLSRYVLKPFYTHVVIKCFPMWMAPNLITLSGFGFIIVNILTLLWYNPTLDQDCPPWVYASWAAGLFLYQTFDAVDGSQARRTHQSGPLGELFDHGVDAVNTSLEVLLFAASQNLGMGWKTVLTLFGALLTFYVQTWDEYHTKTLTLGLISGPVEGIIIMVMVYAFTAIKGGASFWQQSMLATMGVPHYSFILECHQSPPRARRQIPRCPPRSRPLLRNMDTHPSVPLSQPRNFTQPSGPIRLLRRSRQRLLRRTNDHGPSRQARLPILQCACLANRIRSI